MDLLLFYNLQQYQKKLKVIDNELNSFNNNSEMIVLKKEYQRLKQNIEDLESKVKSNTIQQNIRQNEIKNLEENKSNHENVKYSREINTVKKLESIEKQIQEIDEKIEGIKEKLILLLEEGENIEKDIVENKKKMMFIKKKYVSLKEKTENTLKDLNVQKTELEGMITKSINEISIEDKRIYDTIKNSYTDPVALSNGRICSGCSMEIPAMDYEATKTGSTIVICQNCGRMLYYRVNTVD